jgi:hypothetical protein
LIETLRRVAVQFASSLGSDGRQAEEQIDFTLNDASKRTPHLQGRISTERSSET